MPSQTLPEDELRDHIRAAISGMIYISETEEPLELLEWGRFITLEALQHKISEKTGLPWTLQQIIPAADFLAGIHRASDPSDPLMLEYAKRYDALFDLLESQSTEVVIIRCGESESHLFIVARVSADSIIIHTTATET